MVRTFKILALPTLLTFAIVASGLMALMDYLSQRSLRTTYIVSRMRQARPCHLCHDGSFARTSLRVASLPCEVLPRAY